MDDTGLQTPTTPNPLPTNLESPVMPAAAATPLTPPIPPQTVMPESPQITKPASPVKRKLKQHGKKFLVGALMLMLLGGGSYYGYQQMQSKQTVESQAGDKSTNPHALEQDFPAYLGTDEVKAYCKERGEGVVKGTRWVNGGEETFYTCGGDLEDSVAIIVDCPPGTHRVLKKTTTGTQPDNCKGAAGGWDYLHTKAGCCDEKCTTRGGKNKEDDEECTCLKWNINIYECVKDVKPSASPKASSSPTPTIACTDITSNVAAPVGGETATFTCATNFSSVAAPKAFFRYSTDSGVTWSTPAPTGGASINATTKVATQNITLNQPGNWIVQCRVCTSSAATSCTTWGQAN